MATKKAFSGAFLSWPKPHFDNIKKTHKHFRSNFHGAMLYAHYELSSSDLKKEVVKYLKAKNPKDPLIERVHGIHENRFSTVGKYMYILNHGSDIPEDVAPNLMPALMKVIETEEKVIKEVVVEEKPAVERQVVSIQDRLRDRAREVAGEIEGWIDDFLMDKKIPVKTVEEFVNLFKANELKAPHMRHMETIFKRRAQMIEDVVLGKDKDLVEGYSNFTKAELKKHDLFHKNLLQACTMLQEVAKVVRAPRKKKPVSHDKLVAKLKFKKEDSTLGIVSISPVQIIGSKEVWVYNTKTRRLAQYKAADERGLTVKGTGLLQYSSDSMEKTVRKPAETLAEFKKASKVKLRTFLKDLSTVDVSPNGKLNEHHVILRVDK